MQIESGQRHGRAPRVTGDWRGVASRLKGKQDSLLSWKPREESVQGGEIHWANQRAESACAASSGQLDDSRTS